MLQTSATPTSRSKNSTVIRRMSLFTISMGFLLLSIVPIFAHSTSSDSLFDVDSQRYSSLDQTSNSFDLVSEPTLSSSSSSSSTTTTTTMTTKTFIISSNEKNDIPKESQNSINLPLDHEISRRLDRPETVIFKDEKPKEGEEYLNEETTSTEGEGVDNPPTTATATTTTTTTATLSDHDYNNTITLPDPNLNPNPNSNPVEKKKHASKKDQCLSGSTCAQCRMIAAKLEKDQDDAWTCSWQLTQERNKPSDDEGAISSANNVTKQDISSGFCVSIYKTFAAKNELAGGEMVCQSDQAAVAAAAAAVSAAGTESNEFRDIRRHHPYLEKVNGNNRFGFLLILGFLVAGLHLRNRLSKYHSNKPAKGGMMNMMGMSGIARDMEMGMSGNSQNYSQEVVPLSSAREEEWGWDEEGAQSGISSRTMQDKQREEEEDMQMALALSLSAQSNASSSASNISPEKSLSKRNTFGRSRHARKSQTDNMTVRSAPAASKLRSASYKKKSSSSKTVASDNKRTKPRPPSSDIFTSMGISSSRPKFGRRTSFSSAEETTSSNSTVKVSGGSIASSNTKYSSKYGGTVSSKYSKSKPMNTNDEESSVGTNPNWEDDEDLDDLLGD